MIRKFLFLSIIAGLLMAGCNPNEELYDRLDEKTSDAYTETFDYTLKKGDYSTITDLALEDATTAKDSSRISNIDQYNAFADEFKAANYIPKFLGQKFQALDQGSAISVTYHHLGSLGLLGRFSEAESYTLTEADYDSMGEGEYEPGEYDNFSGSVPPEDYLPDFLAGKYPEAQEGDMVAVTYDFYKGGGVVATLTDYYQFKESNWQVVPNTYVLTTGDYDSMGAPGNYDNFSDDVPPEDYLPTFLEEKFPYAEEGDQKYVVYAYYAGYTEVRAKRYTYNGSEWKSYKTVSNQFIHGDEKWVFDPTVGFEMASSDYQLIVDERDSKYINEYGTGEFYSGADSYHSNFSLVIEDRIEFDAETFEGISTEEAQNIMWERILKKPDEPMATRGGLIVMLQKKFPDAQPTKNGVDVYYEVTFDTYNNDRSSSTYTARYQCTAAGDPAEFKYVESNTPYSSE